MKTASSNKLFLSVAIMTPSTLGGWALTDMLGGEYAGKSFLYFGFGAVAAILGIQCVPCLMSRTRVFTHLLFSSAIGLSIIWFMLCLLLPVLWVSTIDVALRIGISLVVSWLCICSAREAFRQVDRSWDTNGKQCFARHYDRSAGTIDWLKVEKSMNLSARLYIPGLSDRWTPVLAVLMFVSMLLGFNLRKAFPLFCVFAWGIPSAFIVAVIVQLIVFRPALAKKVAEIEEANGRPLQIVADRT